MEHEDIVRCKYCGFNEVSKTIHAYYVGRRFAIYVCHKCEDAWIEDMKR